MDVKIKLYTCDLSGGYNPASRLSVLINVLSKSVLRIYTLMYIFMHEKIPHKLNSPGFWINCYTCNQI